jgi:proton-dependent oligopeptide transporter, POT family
MDSKAADSNAADSNAADSSAAPPKPGLLRSFPAVFWVANVMELFERAAYYGLNSVLAIYLTLEVAKGGLGIPEQSVGFLQGLIYALTYVTPVLGGALADRYGYRRMLFVAFSLMVAGYFGSGQAATFAAVLGMQAVMAVGAGLFKPIISGTLARSTNAANSGFGFGVYYWMINLGAFLAPLLVAWYRSRSWTLVFSASAAYCALMLLPTAFLYREPGGQPASTRTLGEVLRGALLVLSDARFMLMIFVYSGFWVLYFQNFGSVLWFLRDFIDPAPANRLFAALHLPFTFDAEMVTVINGATIILLQVLISRLVKDVAPLTTMVVGAAIGTLGFVCLAFSTHVAIFTLGLVVFSTGEMTAHPKYYSYVGLVAPADKKALYMGYAFLYGVIGSLIGSNLGGALYQSMLKPVIGSPEAPGVFRWFWLSFAAVGVLSTVGLLAFNRACAPDTKESEALARRILLGIYALLIGVGGFFFWRFGLAAAEPNYRTLLQATIMLAVGAGGLWVSRRPGAAQQAG